MMEQKLWPSDAEVNDLRNRSEHLLKQHGRVRPANLGAYISDKMSQLPVLGRMIKLSDKDRRLVVREWITDNIEVLVVSAANLPPQESPYIRVETRIYHMVGPIPFNSMESALLMRHQPVKTVTVKYEDFDTGDFYHRDARRNDVFHANTDLSALEQKIHPAAPR